MEEERVERVGMRGNDYKQKLKSSRIFQWYPLSNITFQREMLKTKWRKGVLKFCKMYAPEYISVHAMKLKNGESLIQQGSLLNLKCTTYKSKGNALYHVYIKKYSWTIMNKFKAPLLRAVRVL